ncbi:MAG: NmrA/HSCARG family protein [Gammaproteobacteria bacterium]|nr:NmrA/HSCARG family protein [Gammaproteobacteria bacterium]NIR84868.1 NmrA/HSCARG family protein [Gammaproteobacteria bacterium]NIR91717.1 NmrA/HSCARG family protein [Gammaproteobacteria bacterium]NIU05915.1 NmrA/HSCARG family protein [Gammaproteobacteria bacterium]NIV52962.1 NmrA family NAD(P)-binding protein [Gammaproteobacteria bacterium]
MAAIATEDRVILVTGGTGQQGGAVARNLLERGFRVRALTRNAGSPNARKLAELGAEVVTGDLEDGASLEHALEGAHGAFSVQNFYEAGAEGEVRQGCLLADSAARVGTRHLVYSSVASAQRSTGIPHFETKWRIEEHIRKLGLPYTILRPVFFMENWFTHTGDAIKRGILPQPLSPDTSLQQIALDDIGHFAATAFQDPSTWTGREIDIAGDELTLTRTAQALSRALGHEVTYQQVPWERFRQNAGEELTIMYQWFEKVGYEADIGALRKLHPQLKTFEQFLREARTRV